MPSFSEILKKMAPSFGRDDLVQPLEDWEQKQAQQPDRQYGVGSAEFHGFGRGKPRKSLSISKEYDALAAHDKNMDKLMRMGSKEEYANAEKVRQRLLNEFNASLKKK